MRPPHESTNARSATLEKNALPGSEALRASGIHVGGRMSYFPAEKVFYNADCAPSFRLRFLPHGVMVAQTTLNRFV